MLYAYAGISSHQVPKVMELAGLIWNGITDSIPSHVTVLEWVEKCGLSLTKGCMKKKPAELTRGLSPCDVPSDPNDPSRLNSNGAYIRQDLFTTDKLLQMLKNVQYLNQNHVK